MKINQTLNEVQKYLIYIADALYNLSESYRLDKTDRNLLAKYAEDIAVCEENIKHLKNSLIMKEEMKKKTIEEEQNNSRS